jgi:DNA-directed RNA polymerase subunit RPC12/RpoP
VAISIKCPSCGKTLMAPDEAAGKRAKCPACGNAVLVAPPPADDIGLADLPEERVKARIPAPPSRSQEQPAPTPSDTISIACSTCGKTLKAPASMAGKRAKCPGCGTIVTIPEVILDAEEVVEDYGLQSPLPAPGPLTSSPFTDEDFAQGYPVARPTSSTPAEPDRRPCPMCGEMIAVGAAKCRFCDAIFDATLRKKEKKKRRREYSDEDEDLSGGDWVVALLCSGIGCIIGLIWLIQGKPKAGKMIGVSIGCAVMWNIVGAVLRAMMEAPQMR